MYKKIFLYLSEKRIEPYLSLPITDELPPFWEAWRAFFWQIVIIGFIDGCYAYIGLVNMIGTGSSKWVLLIVAFLFFLFHIGTYRVAAILREKRYNVKCSALPSRKENY